MASPLILPVAEWPSTHRINWEAGLRPPEFIDEGGAAARWRAQTIRTTAASYGRWLGHLRDKKLLDDTSPPELLTDRANLKSYLTELQATNAPATVLHRIVGLERGLAVIAPRGDRSLLRIIIRNLDADFEPPSKRARLVEADALLELGEAVIRQSRTRTALRRSAVFREGLQIAFLAERPLRLSNVAAMELDRHLVPCGGTWRIVFKKWETKNHKPIDVPFPQILVPYMEEYLQEHRVRLMGKRYVGNRLWITYFGTAESPVSLSIGICRRTDAAFGFPISPQRFRACAATSLAVNAPEQVQIAHHILGNDYVTMERSYNQACATDAARHFHAAMEARRGGHRRS